MKKQLMWSKLKVGLVISTALVLLLLTVFFSGKIGDLFMPKVVIKAEIRDVRGLRKGAPVWLSGIEIGFVKDINLSPEYGTLVTMSIREGSVPFIKKDAFANVLTQGLLGDKYIELTSGSPEAGRIMPGSVIKGGAQLEVKDLVEASSKSLSKVTEFVNKVDVAVGHFEKSEGTLSKLMNDPALYDNLKQSSAALLAAAKELNQSQGTLKMLIKDPSLYNNMLAASSSLEKFSKTLNEGNGSIKRLAENPDIYNNLDSASQKLDAVLSRINSGEGAAGVLVNDKELAKQLKEAVSGLSQAVGELKELTKDIKSHPKKYFKFSIF